MTRLRAPLLIVLCLLLLAPFVKAADDTPPTPNDQAKDYAKEFKKDYKKMSEGDVLAGIDKLVAFYKDEKVDEKSVRKELLSALIKAASLHDDVVIVHLMEKCGEMDEEVVQIVLVTLKRELAQKVPKEKIYEAALAALGKLHVENRRVTKEITDLLNNKDFSVIAAAVRAIAGYASAGGEIRKELFEEVLKSSEGVYSSAENNDPNMKKKWNVIGQDVKETLVKLAGVPLDNPSVARQWFNENKKKSWDKEK
jgi:hypothetical protein